MATFHEILYRADRLCSNVKSPKRNLHENAESRVDIALNDIFQCSENLWKRKRIADDRTAELHAGMLLGEKGFNLTTLSSLSKKPSQTEINADDLTVLPSADCTEVLDDVINETSRRTRLEAERAFINQRIFDTAQSRQKRIDVSCSEEKEATVSVNKAGINAMSTAPCAVESEFANVVSDYIIEKKSLKLAVELRIAAEKSCNNSVVVLWDQILAPLLTLTVDTLPAKERRKSVAFMSHVVDSSLAYLHKQFVSHMELVVENNLSVARRGGDPTIISLVNAFLNIKNSNASKRITQDGTYGPFEHALWDVVYQCLRAGDLSTVESIAKSHLKNLPSNAALAICLSSLSDNKPIPSDLEIKLRAEWRSEARTCTDIFKKAIYCALLGGDAPEVCDNLENWLWMKLMPFKFKPSLSAAVFNEFQRLVSVSYGEEYFTSNGGSFLIFFQALWLTGQYERAVNVLYRNDMLLHAIHSALLIRVNDLLICSEDLSQPFLAVEQDDPLSCSLNFCRLVLLYVKRFECTDVKRALDYTFFLKNMESPIGGNLFYSCISRIVYLSGDTLHVIGEIDDDGIRHEGLIDKYAAEIDVCDAIAKVAADTELCDDIILAGQLYKAADRICDAIRLASDALAKEMAQSKSTGKARKLAVWLAGICKNSAEPPVNVSLDMLPNLYLLIDLSTFFNLFRDNRFEACMEIVKKLKCLPLNLDEVQPFVSAFYMVSEQIRLILPDLCLAVMNILNEEFKRDPSAINHIRSQAKAIMLYVAMIPYRFPSHISSEILQLNSRFE